MLTVHIPAYKQPNELMLHTQRAEEYIPFWNTAYAHSGIVG